MSIQLAAKHLAAHGRGPDTTLVHMTPGEVASLQSLAQQHGGSLTTNPHTGLPEAGFLSALLPMAAGAGLAAMGMPAGYAALAVGATSAATNGGDLRKGMMAGISAYGGAGMAESFMGAGLGTMGGAMGTSAAAPATALEIPAGATSPYALTGSTAAAAPSTAGYSLGESSSFLNQPLPSLVSTAPAQVAQAAAAATPAAQAAKQAAALDSMSMGQRWDALKAGATGTNAMNYIKANPFTSLGVATAAMTPDENKTPQKATDTDRGARAGLSYHPGWSTPLPKPNMQGVEQTYNRPYYAAEGGITHMAEGGSTESKDYDGVTMSPAIRELLTQHDRSLREIQRLKAQQAGAPPAPLDQKQLFADYLKRVSGGTGAGTPAGTGTGSGGKYDWWQNSNNPATAKPELPFLETPVSSNTRGGGRGEKPEPSAWDSMTDAQKTEYYAQRPIESGLASAVGNYMSNGFLFGALGKAQDYFNPGFTKRNSDILAGRYPIDNNPLAGGPLQYSSGEPAGYTSSQFSAGEPTGYTSSQFSGAGDGVTVGDVRQAQLTPTELSDASNLNMTPLQSEAEARLQALANQTSEQSLAAGLASIAPTNDNTSTSGWMGNGEGGRYSGNDSGLNAGWGSRDAGGDARGGYLQHGQFDQRMAQGGISNLNQYDLGSYSDGGRLLKGPGDGVSDSIPATIGKGRPARLADGEFVIPARIVSEIGNGSTEAGARKLYAMMDRIQAGRKKSVGKGKVAVNSRADKYLPA